jgi:hypothetical protein
MKKLFIVSAVIIFGVFVFAQTAPAEVLSSTFHGQFRINSYYEDRSDENVFGDEDTVQGSRLRWRPTWDVEMENGVKMHLQFTIGHINSNNGLARFDNGGDPAFALRHAYVLAPMPAVGGIEEWNVVGGLVPWDDKFGQTLFSSDWDFNPLAFALVGKVSNLDIRAAHFNAVEGDASIGDDVEGWVVDAETPWGLGISWYYVNDGRDGSSGIRSAVTGGTAGDVKQHYLGARYARDFGTVGFDGFVVYNSGEIEEAGGPTGPDLDNDGWLAKVQLKAPVGPAKVGLMGIFATGDGQDFGTRDSDSFITPMTVLGLTGYWGYTGKLNVQGPTDTRIDGDNLNVDGAGGNGGNLANLGTGMVSIQANASLPLIPDVLDGYVGIGWYQQEDEKTGTDDDIGYDLIGMATYHFGSGMNWDFGVDFASLGEGHHGSTSASLVNQDRDVVLLFSRFQLEY